MASRSGKANAAVASGTAPEDRADVNPLTDGAVRTGAGLTFMRAGIGPAACPYNTHKEGLEMWKAAAMCAGLLMALAVGGALFG